MNDGIPSSFSSSVAQLLLIEHSDSQHDDSRQDRDQQWEDQRELDECLAADSGT
jgi:hypothetical protein